VAPARRDDAHPARDFVQPGTAQPNAVAVDANAIYWTDTSGSVLSMPLAGGAVTTLASSQTTPWDLVIDGTSVYWTDYGPSGAVMKVAKP
jgi:hypothetical protein